ncbi:MAG TPA: nuclear transport factor 2 family protein, partial [Rhodanobacteraceae bacterium]
MTFRKLLAALLLCVSFMRAQAADVETAVRQADARYWQAYNACDMATMGALLTDDVEFYHDKTGLTTTRRGVLDSLRKGPCGTPGMHLRREAVPGSVRYYPLAGGFAILTGEHRFYVSESGKPEHLDGHADFTIVWQSVDGQWQMRRILSYSHGPAPYTPPAMHLHLAPAA